MPSGPPSGDAGCQPAEAQRGRTGHGRGRAARRTAPSVRPDATAPTPRASWPARRSFRARNPRKRRRFMAEPPGRPASTARTAPRAAGRHRAGWRARRAAARGRRRSFLSGPSGMGFRPATARSNHSRPRTPSIGTAASRPPAASTIAVPPDGAGFGASASSGRASATASTVPRRFGDAEQGRRRAGHAPTTSSLITSRASRTSTASVRPAHGHDARAAPVRAGRTASGYGRSRFRG